MTAEDEEWFAYPKAAKEPHNAPGESPRGAESKEMSFMLQEERTAHAVEQVMPGVSTGALLEAMENPDVFSEIARGDLYVQMARMRSMLPTLTPTMQLDYTKFLAKVGKVDMPERDNSSPLRNVPLIHIDLGEGRSLSLGATEKDITPAGD